MPRIGSPHHLFGVEPLLREFWHRQCAVLLGTARRERRKARHEEVEPREWDEVDRKLPQVATQLAWESDACRYLADGGRHELVQVSVGGSRQLQSAEAEVVPTPRGPATCTRPRFPRAGGS